MNLSTAKKCNSRDAATATLRKLGVTKADYDDFICRRDGVFYVDVLGAEKHVKGEPEVAAEPVAETTVKAKRAKKTDGAESRSDAFRRMIRAGATNQQCWDALQPVYNLDDKKRGYAAWYRNELRKQGEKV